ncbi:hypothetical protein HQ346_14325 [Rhodococcus sp. BP-252]|uniref:MAB_1171c family putative transporter n=1 Tax=unclassified Rhodococcus (in: high G+C Gram-positive bacteria) TaxID=192944 RepID=UPI001C9A7BA2|nr:MULTISPECIES: MAB_1171c family putative transporter [unclassified Rhodococcus (in: high G+C Gram-positive bacteria)]MBY6529800.1 hypothetical protein [Rhodococcus sp. BP-258]MBY6412859.1 hypothetical protein [Rhodococcus sp. BP-320]MBY6417604.1 hypothetical protein [Rhodococcus sp. BP-321]MBY6423456.1 hypothetical protein [Rhodococcus sp. BP-324]MBY6427628.1 hypothetical protein [Rhodococcus sp. BP-323]
MTSSVSPDVAWPVLAFSCLIVLVRCIRFSGSRGERRITSVLGLAIVACILREQGAQQILAHATGDLLSIGFVQQLSTTFIVLAMAPFFLVVVSWSFADEEPKRMATFVYTTAAAFVPVMLLLGSNARRTGQYIDVTEGWETILYFAMFALWVGGMAGVLLWTCFRELFRGNLEPRHRYSYLVVGIIGIWAAEEALSIMGSAVCASLGKFSEFVQLRVAMNENNFVLMTGLGALCAALPAAAAALESLGVDRTSRDIKALRPLWTDLTGACPEVRYLATTELELSSTARTLHRMAVEIWDSILILRRYGTEQSVAAQLPDDLESLHNAVQLRESMRAKSSGASPSSAPRQTIVTTSRHGDEIGHLRAIAAEWARAGDLVDASLPRPDTIRQA